MRAVRADLLTALLCATAAGSPRAAAGDQGAALPEVAGPTARMAVNLERLQQHLDRAEARTAVLSKDKKVPRGIAFDAAAAGDPQEHARVGYGLLVMVLALSQDAAELPLRRVRALGPGTAEVELVLIGQLPQAELSRLRIQGTMGTVAWGGLYFLPEARRTPGPLLADFARGRMGMAFGTLAPGVFGAWDDREPARAEPAAVKAMAARLFPVMVLLPDVEARLAGK